MMVDVIKGLQKSTLRVSVATPEKLGRYERALNSGTDYDGLRSAASAKFAVSGEEATSEAFQ